MCFKLIYFTVIEEGGPVPPTIEVTPAELQVVEGERAQFACTSPGKNLHGFIT